MSAQLTNCFYNRNRKLKISKALL